MIRYGHDPRRPSRRAPGAKERSSLPEQLSRWLRDPVQRQIIDSHYASIPSTPAQLEVQPMKDIDLIPTSPKAHQERRALDDPDVGLRVEEGVVFLGERIGRVQQEL